MAHIGIRLILEGSTPPEPDHHSAVTVGTIWLDTSSRAIKRCISIDPLVYGSVLSLADIPQHPDLDDHEEMGLVTEEDLNNAITGGHDRVHFIDGEDHLGNLPHSFLLGLGNDEHTQYQKVSEKGLANGYASLDTNIKVPFAQLPTGSLNTEIAIGDHVHLGGDHSHAHSVVTGQTPNDHHNQIHAIDSPDHTGQLNHSSLVGLSNDEHPQYQKLSDKGLANGYASLDGSGVILDSQIPSGITRDSELPLPSNTVVTEITSSQAANAGLANTYSRGDHTHGTPVSGGGVTRWSLEGHWVMSVTLTNIGIVYKDLYAATNSDGKSILLDTNGKTNVRLIVNWNKIGTGVQSIRVVDVLGVNVLLEMNIVNGRNDSGIIAIPVLFQNSEKFIKLQVKSTVTGDDPVFEAASLYLK